MLGAYEAEQATLIAASQTLRIETDELKSKTANLQSFMRLVERYGSITELTEEMARAFIEKVVVHEAIFEAGSKRKKVSQQVDIYFTYIGQFGVE